MYVSYERDFQHLHPLRPRDFSALCKRTYAAVCRGGGKVGAKDV